MSKVKLDCHFMMLYASLDALRITRCFTHHSKNRNASIIPHSQHYVKRILKVFHFFSTHRKSSNRLTLDLRFIVIRGRLVQTSSVFPYRMPITGHRNSYSVVKGQIPDGKCCSCFTQRFNYPKFSFPTQGGFWNFLLVGLTGIEPATPALPYHIAFASWSGLCYNHSINGLGSASIVSTHL